MPFIVPPGGFAGFNQMTPASRAALGRVGGTPYKSKRRTRRAKVKAKRARSSRKNGGRKMKFGSPAWQKKYKVGKFKK